jgi:1,4-alpha-glucan branching enzyme
MDNAVALYLFHNGDYLQSYEFFGAHPADGKTTFRLWAPNARAVAVVGNFNDWDAAANPMALLPDSGGVWALTVDRDLSGEIYKYRITQIDEEIAHKADPYAFYAEVRPQTASVVWSLDDYIWHDDAWRAARKEQTPQNKPINIYEMHLGSWRTHEDGTFLNYRELADQLVPYLKAMHYTHVEFMPVMEHPFDGSWGYQVTGFFAPTSRYGTPQDLMVLIDRLHQNDIAVILDWVPGHFCKDAHGLYKLDGTNLYEATEHPQWGTMEFDYNKNEVVNFLISNAYYWFDRYHIDGLRIDGVASIIYLNYGYENEWRRNKFGGNDSLEAVAFLQKLNTEIFKYFPYAIMAAEESTAYPMVTWPVDQGGLGFNMKWDMGWMHDTLSYMETDPYVRSQFHSKLTFSMAYAFSETFVLPLSHDEIVHGKKSILDKMFGDYDGKFDQMRLLYAYMYTHSGKKLTFMGNETAPFIEWRYYEQLEWFMLDNPKHRQFHQFIQDLNKHYLNEPALWQEDHSWDGFQWIDADNAKQSIIIFRRMGKDPQDDLIILINFCPQDYPEYDIGVPTAGTYRLLFNSDDAAYGGKGAPVKKTTRGKKGGCHNQPFTATLRVPGLTALIYKAVRHRKPAAAKKTRAKTSRAKKTTEKRATLPAKAPTTQPAVKDDNPKPLVKQDKSPKAIAKTDKKAYNK